MSGKINRSFSLYPSDESSFDDISWYHLPSLKEKDALWHDLLKKRLVVIVGETGIGKTYEFKNKVKTLADEGQAAFFLPLNMLASEKGFEHSIFDQRDRYDWWAKSNETGFFFLDAIDESRLISTIAFKTALTTVCQVLESHLQRVSFFISSRIPDWNIKEVRDAVETYILKPLNNAECSNLPLQSLTSDGPIIKGRSEPDPITLEVFKLDQLSTVDAKILAENFGAKPVDVFWQNIEEGGYEFLAARPFDLQLLSSLWKQKHTLGTYSEILEAAIKEGLTEKNQSYIDSSAVLSRDELRQGSEQLAAACIFSGCHLIRVKEDAETARTIAAADVLSDLTPLEHLRLLGAAIYDAATYGRFSFHHRTVREYLTACWVDRQIMDGLPINHALALFVLSPYGYPVLIKSRRSVFCWLASLNAIVRQRLIQDFPEMLMFEGDPQSWSTEDVIGAFEGYIRKIEAGYKQDWWNAPSESIRVARMLPGSLMSKYLDRYRHNRETLSRLLLIVGDGKMDACADIVFKLYRDKSVSESLHQVLDALSSIAKPEHKTSITTDLLTGTIKTNRLIAAALEIVGIENLNLDQIQKIISNADEESEYGNGPLTSSIKYNILAKLNYEETLKLLSALLALMGHRRYSNMNNSEGEMRKPTDWVLTIIPEVTLNALQLRRKSGTNTLPSPLVDSLMLIVERKNSRSLYHREFKQLREELEREPELRRRLILDIVISSSNSQIAIFDLTYMQNLVYLSKNDLDWLTQEANRENMDPTERNIFYEIAKEIALYKIQGLESEQALNALAKGVDAAQRKIEIELLKKQLTNSRRTVSDWELKDRKQGEKEQQSFQENKAELLKNVDGIRSGKWFNAIRWLIQYATEQNREGSYTKVNTEPIYRDFGKELGDALTEGLTIIWREIDVPDPFKFPNSIPWVGIVALAGINYSFAACRVQIEELSTEEIERVVKLSIWDPHKHEPWFDQLVVTHADAVSALMPWFELELKETDENIVPKTVELVLSGPGSFKAVFLNHALSLLRKGKVGRESLERKIVHELIVTDNTSKALVTKLALNRLSVAVKVNPPSFARKWFRDLLSSNFPAAMQWIHNNSSLLWNDATLLASDVAVSLEKSSWAENLSGKPEEIEALISLFRFLNVKVPTSNKKTDKLIQTSSIQVVREQVIGKLKSFEGKYAQAALQELASQNVGTQIGNWILSMANEHASNAAEQRSIIPPDQLKLFGEIYTRDPQSADDLFVQVIARLEEIQEGVEHGPFSDRVFLKPGLEEKHLQLWLAARLNDTPRRRFNPRFGVSREPQVDDDKRTDLEVSCSKGKISIEIKPLDSKRPYTAVSLTRTLKNQLVKKYLHGGNCHHGVLVLFRLDKKNWRIPGGQNKGTFEDLKKYLKLQAAKIQSRDEKVKQLMVLGIDCYKSNLQKS